MRGTSATVAAPSARRQVLLASIAFIIGFSLVFVSLGASASAVGGFVGRRLPLLGKVAGVVLVLFGLHTMGVFRLRWLEAEKRVQTRRRPAGLFGSVLVGIAFAFGWTPCIGPILAGILTIAGAQDTVGQGVKLLAVYSAGLGLPFLLTALAVNQFFAASARIRRYYHAIEVASGALLVAIGVLIFTNQFSVIARYLQNFLPTY
jgi:cytochrome c-type biogenesis protein